MTKDVDALKPLIRWAGGKRWMTSTLEIFMPKKFNFYHEPFLGGAASFLHFLPQKGCYLSDSNTELINFYVQIRDNPKKVINGVLKLPNNEKKYYEIRESNPQDNLNKAIRFLYLNKTCFNGLYRVNSNNEFNVPYGFRKKVDLANAANLLLVSKSLKKATLTSQDFEESFKRVRKGDLVFIDPPYTVAHNNNGFIEYNQKIFSWEDQERLAEGIRKLDNLGAYYILTNAVHNSIIKLYSNLGNRFEIERASTISGHMKDRKIITEFIITNCI